VKLWVPRFFLANKTHLGSEGYRTSKAGGF